MPFAIYHSLSNNTLCIQCPAGSGQSLTLQTYTEDSSQLWNGVLQINNDGAVGIAFVNPSTNLSITFNGENQPLVAEPYSFGSTDQDAWTLLNLNNGFFRIAYPPNTNWCLLGAGPLPGTPVILVNDPVTPLSTWAIVAVGLAAAKKAS